MARAEGWGLQDQVNVDESMYQGVRTTQRHNDIVEGHRGWFFFNAIPVWMERVVTDRFVKLGAHVAAHGRHGPAEWPARILKWSAHVAFELETPELRRPHPVPGLLPVGFGDEWLVVTGSEAKTFQEWPGGDGSIGGGRSREQQEGPGAAQRVSLGLHGCRDPVWGHRGPHGWLLRPGASPSTSGAAVAAEGRAPRAM